MAKVPFLSLFFTLIWVTYYGLSSTVFYEKYSTPIIIALFISTAILVTLICNEFCKLDGKLEDLEDRIKKLEEDEEDEDESEDEDDG